MACAFARVHAAYVYRWRSANPDFAREWDAAKVEAGQKLCSERLTLRPRRMRGAGGEVLVVTGFKSGQRRRIQRARPRDWTRADERRFLDILASTANVELAAKMAGHSSASAYARRKVDPGFAAEWVDAELIGRYHVDMKLLVDAGEAFLNPYRPKVRNVRVPSVKEAIDILAQFQWKEEKKLEREWREKMGWPPNRRASKR